MQSNTELRVVSETTDTTAVVYLVNSKGHKHGYYRQSLWNAEPKFRIIYDGQTGMRKVLRAPDVVADYNYVNDELDGAYSITRYYLANNFDDAKAPIRSKLEGNYHAGKKAGFEREYVFSSDQQATGQLIRESHYRDGKLDGYVRKFDVDGNLVYSLHFTDGLKHGTETHFTTDGAIWRINRWIEGLPSNHQGTTMRICEHKKQHEKAH